MVNEAYAINEKNRNTLWQDAIQKEMVNGKIAVQIIPKGENVKCRMIYNIQMKDFQRKVWLVVGGNMTNTTDTLTYSIVVTRETVCITLTMAAL